MSVYKRWYSEEKDGETVWEFEVTMRDDEYTTLDTEMTPEDIAADYYGGKWSFVNLRVNAIVNYVTLGHAEIDGVGWGTIGGQFVNPLDDMESGPLAKVIKTAKENALRELATINKLLGTA